MIRGGTLYDGSGEPAVEADLAIDGDRIASVAPRIAAAGRLEIDARGLAVAPGFINILSWAAESLLQDGRSQGDIRQGVTVEIFGEGESMGPLTPASREALIALQGDITYDVSWTTLGEFLDHLVERGISPNVGSFVGATTIRVHEVGWEDRRPTPTELERMRELVRAEMRGGALGVGSSLIYTPACFADTAELIALAAAAAETDGLYISHIRNEGEHIVAALDEVTRISREAGARVEVYHLKSAGRRNWPRIEDAISTIEGARAAGIPITADMYPYPASGTGLDATMPPWVQEGGMDAWIARLQDPAVRGRVADEMRRPGVGWENELYNAGAEAVMVVGFRTPALQHLTGATITAIAADRGLSPEETIMDLVIEDRSRVSSVYFTQSEDVVRRVAGLPWVSIGSDEGSYAPEGVFLRSQPHPRAYGSFARFLGHLVRELGVTTLADAIRRITSLPAAVLRLDDRGRLARGYVADVVVFDPERIADRATFDAPHQLAVGVEHVLVNGVHTLAAGEHTGARAGRVARGPGWLPGG
ncbi:MAG TPA: amidohydrolase family protein [Candidatus Limnocylindria bacterium]|nr:amidohydrolase family protein [Candidatus Limnocylindria bacterium]